MYAMLYTMLGRALWPIGKIQGSLQYLTVDRFSIVRHTVE